MDGQSKYLPSHPPAGTDGCESVGIGRRITRLEDERLLRGGSRYVSDLIATSGALRVKVLRSPHAHARLLAIDATVARALSGVAAVLTADDLAGIGDLPCDWVAPGMDVVPLHPVLARDRVRYVGEPIAAVAAETADAAEDALAAITVARLASRNRGSTTKYPAEECMRNLANLAIPVRGGMFRRMRHADSRTICLRKRSE